MVVTVSKFINVKVLSKEEDVKEICLKYWALDSIKEFIYKVPDICTDSHLSSYELTRVIKNSTMVTSEMIACIKCGDLLPFKTRSAYLNLLRAVELKSGKECICSSCQRKLDEEADWKTFYKVKEALKEENYIPFKLEELSLSSLAFLKALFDHSASESLSCIKPIKDNSIDRLAPNRMVCTMVNQLINENIISINQEFDYGYFSSKEKIELECSDIFSIEFLVNFDRKVFDQTSFYLSLSESLYERLSDKSAITYFCRLSHMLMHEEILEFMNLMLERYRMPFVPGEKTRLVLNDLLENHSLSEIMYFIWKSVNSAAAYSRVEGISISQAANSIVGEIQQNRDNFVKRGWSFPEFTRHYKMPESILGRVVYGPVFGQVDAGFDLSLLQQQSF
jgi:hypothetical protein